MKKNLRSFGRNGKVICQISIVIISIFGFFNASVAQSKKTEYYKPVNIDSLLQTPIHLPINRNYIIKRIQFSISTDSIVDIGETGETERDRFLQLKDLSPNEDWKNYGAVYFKMRSANLALEFGTLEQFHKVVNLSKSWSNKKYLDSINEIHIHKELNIKAKMLIGKFKRYNTTRDFLIQNIQVNNQ